MTIEKCLDISTCHVKRETMNPASANKYCITEYEYGAFFYVPDLEDIEKDTPSDLRDVLQFAKDNNCYLVRLDSVGEVYDGLETYDW